MLLLLLFDYCLLIYEFVGTNDFVFMFMVDAEVIWFGLFSIFKMKKE